MSNVNDLKAENEKLRDENERMHKLVKMPDEPLEIDEKDFYVRAFIKWAIEEQPEVKRLQAENAKLRELARDMFDGMCGYGHDCRDCEHYELLEGQRFVGECEYHRRMRELGIEVDA